MDICHRYPELTRSKWRMRPKVSTGITRRVERVQREMADADRREWFELHCGEEKWGNKTELFKILVRCKAELKGYPHYPWRTPKVRELKGYRTGLICCGYFHPHARRLHAFLEQEELRAFQRAVFNERAHEGEVLGRLVREYLAEGSVISTTRHSCAGERRGRYSTSPPLTCTNIRVDWNRVPGRPWNRGRTRAAKTVSHVAVFSVAGP
ncbi:hypothetical protein [Streptomyces sp. NPDC056069]|uniref:hypothetical protein n=1 Tax=Streptomyces sp. NPDC056069 TaxID=3345702 RepID=UPI0035DBCC7B